MNYFLAFLPTLLELVMVVILIRVYLRTRDVGFVWLGVALVVWPWISLLLQLAERSPQDRMLQHQVVGFFPYTLVEHHQMTMGELVFLLGLVPRVIGSGLILVAVIYLGKTRSTGMVDSPIAS